MARQCFRMNIAALLLAAGALSCGGEKEKAGGATADAPRPEKVSLQLNWYAEAEHGGFYAAQALGFYAEEGLDVTIAPGGVDVPVLQIVAGGARDYGVANADDVLIGRAAGADVVALFTPLHSSPRCIMVHEESGITRLEELQSVTLAMSPRAAFSHFLRKELPLTEVRIVGYAGVAPFLADKRYAMQGYNFSEPFIARGQGANPRVLLVSELGFDPYTSVLFTTEREIAKRPDVARKMARASLRGWRAYLEDASAANAAIHRANPEMGLDILEFGAEQLRPLAEVAEEDGGAAAYGTMTLSRWSTLAGQLEALELIPVGKVLPQSAFRNDLLEAEVER